jgi:hypothetical protein
MNYVHDALVTYDRIWMCPSLKRKEWIEATTKSQRLISCDDTFSDEAIGRELAAYEDATHNHWEYAVSLSMGGDTQWYEIYLFLSELDCQRFFQAGPLGPGEQSYHDREYIYEGAGPGGCNLGKGFEWVALLSQGELVTEHSGPALKGRIYPEGNSLSVRG